MADTSLLHDIIEGLAVPQANKDALHARVDPPTDEPAGDQVGGVNVEPGVDPRDTRIAELEAELAAARGEPAPAAAPKTTRGKAST